MSEPDIRSSEHRAIAADIAKELREHPENWVKFDYGRKTGPACLAGHISRRCATKELQHQTYDAFLAEADIGVVAPLSFWNDNPSRTIDEVVALCERVAMLEKAHG